MCSGNFLAAILTVGNFDAEVEKARREKQTCFVCHRPEVRQEVMNEKFLCI
jgi:cytochrome c551/c552